MVSNPNILLLHILLSQTLFDFHSFVFFFILLIFFFFFFQLHSLKCDRWWRWLAALIALFHRIIKILLFMNLSFIRETTRAIFKKLLNGRIFKHLIRSVKSTWSSKAIAIVITPRTISWIHLIACLFKKLRNKPVTLLNWIEWKYKCQMMPGKCQKEKSIGRTPEKMMR